MKVMTAFRRAIKVKRNVFNLSLNCFQAEKDYRIDKKELLVNPSEIWRPRESRKRPKSSFHKYTRRLKFNANNPYSLMKKEQRIRSSSQCDVKKLNLTTKLYFEDDNLLNIQRKQIFVWKPKFHLIPIKGMEEIKRPNTEIPRKREVDTRNVSSVFPMHKSIKENFTSSRIIKTSHGKYRKNIL